MVVSVEYTQPPAIVRSVSHPSMQTFSEQLENAAIKLGLRAKLPIIAQKAEYHSPANLHMPAYMQGSHTPFVHGSLATDVQPKKISSQYLRHATRGEVRGISKDLLHEEISALFASNAISGNSVDVFVLETADGFALGSEQEVQLQGLRELYSENQDVDFQLNMHKTRL